MKRLNQEDVNTPERYDGLYFGERSHEIMPYNDVVNLLQALNPRGDVLDVGCGPGRYFFCFPGSTVYGTELSLKSIEEAQKNYPAFFITQWFAGNPLPYNENKFDLVWAGEVLEHVEDPQSLTDEIYRVMKPGSTAVFTTPFEESIICPEHIWAFNRQDITNLFSKFNGTSVFRLSNEPIDRWEHFCVLARK